MLSGVQTYGTSVPERAVTFSDNWREIFSVMRRPPVG
jgi:hypothetical protein